jgi:hypothetical protein
VNNKNNIVDKHKHKQKHKHKHKYMDGRMDGWVRFTYMCLWDLRMDEKITKVGGLS